MLAGKRNSPQAAVKLWASFRSASYAGYDRAGIGFWVVAFEYAKSTRLGGSATGSFFRSSASTHVKIAALAPIAKPSDRTAAAVNPGLFLKMRIEYSRSCRKALVISLCAIHANLPQQTARIPKFSHVRNSYGGPTSVGHS